MSMKISACWRLATRARCTVFGLKLACSPIRITSEGGYTPRQSAIAAESLAVAGVAWTTALWPVDHKTPNRLKTQEVWS